MNLRTRLGSLDTRLRPAVVVGAALAMLVSSSAAAVTGWFQLPLDQDDAYVVLVMGSDEGPPRGGSARAGRADAIHLVVVDPEREHVSILNFPRDSYVPVVGFGTTKINSMLVGGPEAAMETMTNLTGLQVDDYILTGFHGFIAAIDELGGVEVEVEQRLNNVQASTDLQPGLQRLVGWQTLAFSRDRKSRSDGDIGRSEAQTEVLMALHREFVGAGLGPGELVDVVSTVRRHTETSIPSDRLFRLGALALSIDPANVGHITVPGNIGTAGDASVIRLTSGADALYADLRDDGRFAVFDE